MVFELSMAKKKNNMKRNNVERTTYFHGKEGKINKGMYCIK